MLGALAWAGWHMWLKPPSCAEAISLMDEEWRKTAYFIEQRRDRAESYGVAHQEIEAKRAMADSSATRYPNQAIVMSGLDMPWLPDEDAREALRSARRATRLAKASCFER